MYPANGHVVNRIAPQKECPECGTLCHAAKSKCDRCNHDFSASRLERVGADDATIQACMPNGFAYTGALRMKGIDGRTIGHTLYSAIATDDKTLNGGKPLTAYDLKELVYMCYRLALGVKERKPRKS